MRKSGRNPKPCLRERCTAPNGVGKVCKPSVLPCPMYKLPLAPSQLPTFHRTFKQIFILPSRVNWRERLVYEGLQDCSRCKNPFSHQTVNKLCVHLFCTSSHYLRKVNLDSWCWSLFLLDWRSLQCNVVFTFQFWTIFLPLFPLSLILWGSLQLLTWQGGLLTSPACTALFFV